MTSLPFARPLFILLLAAPLACSGTVETSSSTSGVAGAGGVGSSASSNNGSSGITMTTGPSMVSSSGGGDCGSLGMNYAALLDEARKCNACLDFDGCINGPVFPDLCGCPVAIDSSKSELNAKVKEAFGIWQNAGCKPFGCGQPCATGTSWACQPNGMGCDGVCSPQ